RAPGVVAHLLRPRGHRDRRLPGGELERVEVQPALPALVDDVERRDDHRRGGAALADDDDLRRGRAGRALAEVGRDHEVDAGRMWTIVIAVLSASAVTGALRLASPSSSWSLILPFVITFLGVGIALFRWVSKRVEPVIQGAQKHLVGGRRELALKTLRDGMA